MNHHDPLLEQLNQLISEGRNPDTLHIDTASTLDIVTAINTEDHKVAPAVAACLPDIARAVDYIADALQNGGRLIYTGAGTSGRLGILDAVECRPTFSVPDTLVVGVIAGGKTAIEHAVEGAEDDHGQGALDLADIRLSAHDVVVGLSASGRTPYVTGALAYARQTGCKTIGVACSPNTPVLQAADVAICPLVGPEALTGSTRMKSGTAQKLVLNMLSTATMIKQGKTYQNLMVDVNATNHKLKARARRIVMQATDCDEATATDALQQADQQAKLAILLVLTGLDVESARTLLSQQNGYLRHALKAHC
ncbi:N-acetylmuramic acid 6-phosphate etherase [Salinimonas lutimaris]|uniref:N-acetylmuramic acid 6-phosphate etherase n=1 Tax=Salinimonas lutimaris TaxID=914153 RepID=UPI0010C11BC2|nr:N-acetylmuramic acid 6-phosphate etherase [Salinimonas lutimaris]